MSITSGLKSAAYVSLDNKALENGNNSHSKVQINIVTEKFRHRKGGLRYIFIGKLI